MADEEFRRATRKRNKLKKVRVDSMEAHVKVIIDVKARIAAIEVKEDALTASIAGIVSVPKQTEINELPAIVELRAIYAARKDNFTSQLSGERTNLSNLNQAVQGDGLYTAAEKQDFADATTNEV
jgi:hypothetical protein